MLTYTVAQKLLDTINGAGFAGIDTVTAVKLTGGKSNPQQGRVTKLHNGANVMLFTNKKTNAYKAMVERRLTAEGKKASDFQLQPRKWGKRVENSPFVEHNGEYYIEVIFLKAGTSEYELDRKPVNKADIVGLPKVKAGGQGGLEDNVIIRTYKLSSIRAIRIDRTEYTF